MKYFDRVFDWLEARPLWQIFAGVVLAFFMLLLLTGCEPPKKIGYYDQDVRREVFFECLKVLPAGPQSTRYNDWSEVVDECGDQALALSARGFSDTRAAAKVEK